jgi:hypothetical protein
VGETEEVTIPLGERLVGAASCPFWKVDGVKSSEF